MMGLLVEREKYEWPHFSSTQPKINRKAEGIALLSLKELNIAADDGIRPPSIAYHGTCAMSFIFKSRQLAR